VSARHPSQLGHVIELAGQRGHSEGSESLRAYIGFQSLLCFRNAQQLGFQVGVGLFEQLDGFVDGDNFHACEYDDGL